MAPYAAAKAGVVAMTEVLRVEMAPHGVGVSVLCPGPVATNFSKTTAREGGRASGKWAHIVRMDIATLAQCVLRGIETDEPYIISHPEYLPGFEQRADGIRQAFLRQREAV